MEIFSSKLVKFLRMYNFDGVLLDYEFPGMVSRGSKPYSKQGYSLLIKVNFTMLF